MKRYVIDGASFSTLEEFYVVFEREVLDEGSEWGRNLDALNDVLRGGFGTPEEGFILIWHNAAASRERLGFAETVRQLGRRLERSHPDNRGSVQQQLDAAKRGEGQTVFDWLIEIIRAHGPGGEEQRDNVTLVLEDDAHSAIDSQYSLPGKNPAPKAK